MKKIILATFAFSLIATSAFAAASEFTSVGGVGATTVLQGFKTSKMVVVAVNANLQSYAAAADHANGTRVFGVSSGDPLVYFMEKTPDGTNTAATELGAGSDSTAFTAWSSL